MLCPVALDGTALRPALHHAQVEQLHVGGRRSRRHLAGLRGGRGAPRHVVQEIRVLGEEAGHSFLNSDQSVTRYVRITLRSAT